MDAEALKDAKLFEKAKEAWGTWTEAEDPRRFWVLGWKRVAKVLKEDKREKNQTRNESRLRQELREVRQLIVDNNSAENRLRLVQLEEAVRKVDHFNTAAWRKRSRIRWLQLGDLLTKYFFAQLRAKTRKGDNSGTEPFKWAGHQVRNRDEKCNSWLLPRAVQGRRSGGTKTRGERRCFKNDRQKGVRRREPQDFLGAN
jgi:hypothetical protein